MSVGKLLFRGRANPLLSDVLSFSFLHTLPPSSSISWSVLSRVAALRACGDSSCWGLVDGPAFRQICSVSDFQQHPTAPLVPAGCCLELEEQVCVCVSAVRPDRYIVSAQIGFLWFYWYQWNLSHETWMFIRGISICGLKCSIIFNALYAYTFVKYRD